MGWTRGELSSKDDVAEIGDVSFIADSDMEGLASVGITSYDVGPMNAAAEQSHISANAPQDAPGEQAQAAEAETGGRRGDEPARDIAAVVAPQVLPESEWLAPGADARPPLDEPISVAWAECIGDGGVPAIAAAEIASSEVACSALMDFASTAPLPISVTEELFPDVTDAHKSARVKGPDDEPAVDPACCADLPDSSDGDDHIILREPSTGDPGRLAITRTETTGGVPEADAPTGRPEAAVVGAGASPDGGVPDVTVFDAESDAIEVPHPEIAPDIIDTASSGPERSTPQGGVVPTENEAGRESGPGRPPTYRPRLERSRTRREPGLTAANAEREYQDLEADLQLLFGPGDWGIELSALLRQPVGAEEVAVLEGGDETWLGALDDRLLEPLALADGARVLSEGLSIAAVGLPVRWHRSSRDIHIFGEHPSVAGFVSQPRVAIGRENVVVCKDELSGVALAQIAATGASAPIRIEGPGVPADWFCWRGIRPARPSAPQDGPAILHALDPLPAVSIELAGGLQLARGRWLEGHPPSIRLLGLLEPGEPVRIDGRTASLEGDGTWAAEGWDRRGGHRIEYGGITATYEVEPGSLVWDWWPAWGETTAVAGALASANGGEYFHVDPFAHLLGAVPGEICSFSAAIDGIYVARPEFTPVWLLARAASMRSSKPSLIGAPLAPSASADAATSAIIRWARTICSAGRAGARGSAERRLWDQYLAVAKRKRRPLR
ncbi:hypothetical protein [Mesorhizobium cantuariense]|uniref:Uncharacterized protein n=1 Tax=Mesorhizobium cantuariense TaxID=1300275 RepID=A0ABV7MWP8_9HYPH